MTFKTRKMQFKTNTRHATHTARPIKRTQIVSQPTNQAGKQPAYRSGKQTTSNPPANQVSKQQINKQINDMQKKRNFEIKKNKNTPTRHTSSKTQSHGYQNAKQAGAKKTEQATKFNPGFSDRLRIIPLGGCEEVGRNMTVFEYKNDIVIIDMGMQFPEEDQLGIDFIIPNTDYLKGREKNIRAVIFTHGHLDHIGATPLLMEKLGWPLLIGSKLTIEMIKARQEDYKKGSVQNLKVSYINNFENRFKFGNFNIKFFPVSHSIMDATGIILETPNGTVIHPGDWKLDHDPNSQTINYKNLARLQRPTILMLESLGITYNKPAVPEKEMYANLDKIFGNAPGRVIVGTFSSNVERAAIILEMAKKYNRKVALDGFSMKKNVGIAKELGYIKFNLKNLIDIKQATKVPDNQLIIVCTGAQGEDRAALNRIANGDHRFIKFKKEDTVIFSSSVIPGNERSVQRLKDLIYRQSDNVIHSEIMDVHSGGHATAADIAEVLRQIKPNYFIPVYANHYMLKEAAKLAKKIGYTDKNIFVPDNGSVIEFAKRSAKMLDKKVMTDPVMVDGLGVSDLQQVVLRDRKILAEDGMVVVVATIRSATGKLASNPDIISRGFVYLKENKELMSGVRKKVRKIAEDQNSKKPVQDDYLRNKIRNDIGQFLFSKTEKRPMVLPVVIEV